MTLHTLQHISAPLMEFERQKLIKQFTTEGPPPPPPTEEEESGAKPVTETEGEEAASPVYVDYKYVYFYWDCTSCPNYRGVLIITLLYPLVQVASGNSKGTKDC